MTFLPIRHVSVLLLYNSKGEILLQHRSENAIGLPGYWAFFGGGIEKGESPEEALVREISEELNYKSTEAISIGTIKFRREKEGPESDKHVFVEKYDEKTLLILNEGQGMGWFLPQNTLQLKIVDHDRPVIEKAAAFIKNQGLKT